MKTLKFKTNISCAGCVSAITPHLNKVIEIDSWKVDLNDPGKVLIVNGEEISAEKLKEVVEGAGFILKEEA